jgi:hypothetical protein
LGKDLAANFEIKAQITDRKELQDGSFTVFFNYSATGEKDVTTNIDLFKVGADKKITEIDALEKHGLLYPFPYVGDLLFAASAGGDIGGIFGMNALLEKNSLSLAASRFIAKKGKCVSLKQKMAG